MDSGSVCNRGLCSRIRYRTPATGVIFSCAGHHGRRQCMFEIGSGAHDMIPAGLGLEIIDKNTPRIAQEDGREVDIKGGKTNNFRDRPK